MKYGHLWSQIKFNLITATKNLRIAYIHFPRVMLMLIFMSENTYTILQNCTDLVDRIQSVNRWFISYPLSYFEGPVWFHWIWSMWRWCVDRNTEVMCRPEKSQPRGSWHHHSGASLPNPWYPSNQKLLPFTLNLLQCLSVLKFCFQLPRH